MRRAARRGVDVRLILQGEPDMPIVKTAASMLYHHLLDAGVRIYEYCDRPLHGKVAVIDDEWATVGSSNLDPLSLSLNLEANVVIRDRAFNQELGDRLDALMQHSCKQIEHAQPDRAELVAHRAQLFRLSPAAPLPGLGRLAAGARAAHHARRARPSPGRRLRSRAGGPGQTRVSA
jgi:phosphatidylserine/phosphatidylglycerophosphate/cardiolipin synthase-like enzyme